MNILQVHNYYQHSGGEDQVLMSDYSVLTEKGHVVNQFTTHNQTINQLNKMDLVMKTLWNAQIQNKLNQSIRIYQPVICHFHNTFPLISPSGYYSCQKNNIPVVQTLHNFRLICPNALLFRDNHICEDCVEKFVPWPGVWHACYRNSHLVTGVVAAMLTLHRILRSWKNQVDVFVALTKFGKSKFVQGGVPEEKVVISPNIIDPDPQKKEKIGHHAIFVGRLSLEKGLRTVLYAWEHLPHIPLNIVGDGPMMGEIQSILSKQDMHQVRMLGRKSHNETLELMKDARILIFPSQCYEGFPLTIAEAYACGLPVIASRLGAMAELIKDGETGLLFTPGNSNDLVKKVLSCWDDRDSLDKMGSTARKEYQQKYTKKQKYESLMHIYEKAINAHNSKR